MRVNGTQRVYKFEKVGFLREENMIVVDQLVFVAGYVCLGS